MTFGGSVLQTMNSNNALSASSLSLLSTCFLPSATKPSNVPPIDIPEETVLVRFVFISCSSSEVETSRERVCGMIAGGPFAPAAKYAAATSCIREGKYRQPDACARIR
ncbi:hypothetical protein L208DRAFT_336151 [Tricholoma matsutake]|nr:hypothetical protein L208DRAFT_336151 [Tricholoma matsutake 945]